MNKKTQAALDAIHAARRSSDDDVGSSLGDDDIPAADTRVSVPRGESPVPRPPPPLPERPTSRVGAVGKKKLKKKKTPAEVNRELDPDPAFASMLERMRDESGEDNVYTSDESEQLVAGLSLPAFALRYLFQMDICPLGRVVQIIGERGSCKSALLYEMARWTLIHSGLAALMENEGKDSPDLRNSILENNPAWIKRFAIDPCGALEDWQEGLQRRIKWADDYFSAKDDKVRRKKADAPARAGQGNWRYPCFFGVDSFMATNARETADNINSRGHSTRGWALEANLIARYARNLPSWIRGRPILIAGTNHLKPGSDSAGRPKDNVPGGAAIGFYETLEIKMQRIKPIEKISHGGVMVKLTTTKNSLGQTKRSITANLEWEWRPHPETGDPIQYTYWDWYAASIDLLVATKKNASIWNAVNDVVDLHTASGRRVWSKVLGIPSDRPTSYTKAGQKLEENPDLMEELYPILRIKRRTQFRPGEDFMVQARRGLRLKEDTTRIYEIHDLSGMSYIDQALHRAKAKSKRRRGGPDTEDDTDDGEAED